MKKPTLRIEEQQPRNIQRADIVPTIGYAIVVDGHFKTQFSDESAAKKAAKELLSNYPMLQIEIYDATAKTRTLMKKWQEAALPTDTVTMVGALTRDRQLVTEGGMVPSNEMRRFGSLHGSGGQIPRLVQTARRRNARVFQAS